MRIPSLKYWTETPTRAGSALLLLGLLSILIVIFASTGEGEPALSANELQRSALRVSPTGVEDAAGSSSLRRPDFAPGGRDGLPVVVAEDDDGEGGSHWNAAAAQAKARLQPKPKPQPAAEPARAEAMTGAALRAAAEAKRSATPTRTATETAAPTATPTASTSPSPSPPLPIPAVVHMAWHTSVLPPDMAAAVAALMAANADFDFRMHDAAAQRAFLKRNFPAEVLAAYDALKPQAYKSDLFRYALLWKQGGIWIDTKLTSPAAAYPGDASAMATALQGFTLSQLRSQGHLGFDRTWTEPEDADDAEDIDGAALEEAETQAAGGGAPEADSDQAGADAPAASTPVYAAATIQDADAADAGHHDRNDNDAPGDSEGGDRRDDQGEAGAPLNVPNHAQAAGAVPSEVDAPGTTDEASHAEAEAPADGAGLEQGGSTPERRPLPAETDQDGQNGAQDGQNGAQDGQNGAQDGQNGAQDSQNGAQDGQNGAQDSSSGSASTSGGSESSSTGSGSASASSSGSHADAQPAVPQRLARALRRHSGRLASNDGRVDLLMGFMVLPPGCPLMHAAVIAIVQHVKDRFMGRPGSGFLDITGPALLMALHGARPALVPPSIVFDLDTILRSGDLAVRWRGRDVLRPYRSYREEQKHRGSGPSYVAAWFEGADAVYDAEAQAALAAGHSGEFYGRSGDGSPTSNSAAAAGSNEAAVTRVKPRAFYGGFDQHMLHVAATTALRAARSHTSITDAQPHSGGWSERLPMPSPAARDPEGAPSPRKHALSQRFSQILRLAEDTLSKQNGNEDGHSGESRFSTVQPLPYWELPHVAQGFYSSGALNGAIAGSLSRNIFLTWPTKALPPAEQAAVAELRARYSGGSGSSLAAAAAAAGAAGAVLSGGASAGDGQRANVIVLEDAGARELIADFYRREPEVLWALDALLPGAYRADLISFAVLHAMGGVYMDMSKEELVNRGSGGLGGSGGAGSVPSRATTTGKIGELLAAGRSRFAVDTTLPQGPGYPADVCHGVYPGFMVARAGHPLLRAAVDAIVFHARNGFIGSTPWDATSSQLLCRLVRADPKLLPSGEGDLVYEPSAHAVLLPQAKTAVDGGSANGGAQAEYTIVRQREGYRPPAGESYKRLWQTARVWRDEVIALNLAEKQAMLWLPLVDPTMA